MGGRGSEQTRAFIKHKQRETAVNMLFTLVHKARMFCLPHAGLIMQESFKSSFSTREIFPLREPDHDHGQLRA